MPHDQHRQFVLDAFTAAVTRHSSKEQRLKNGLYLRSQFQQALQQGVVPAHPRFEWLRKSARTMLELLLTMAKDYEKANPNGSDRVSMADILDIANMAQGHINSIIQSGFMDPDLVELLPYEAVQPQVHVATGGATTEAEPDLAAAIKDDEEGE